jgi:hypothetical protein
LIPLSSSAVRMTIAVRALRTAFHVHCLLNYLTRELGKGEPWRQDRASRELRPSGDALLASVEAQDTNTRSGERDGSISARHRAMMTAATVSEVAAPNRALGPERWRELFAQDASQLERN